MIRISVSSPPPTYMRSSLSVANTTTAEAWERLRRCTMRLCGDVAEWLGRGLQSLVHRFESGRRLF